MELTDFLSYLESERRYSRHTIEAYQRDLGQFEAFLLATYNIAHWNLVETLHVRSWLASLIELGLNASSVHRKRSALHSFFEYLIKTQEYTLNPCDAAVAPKQKKRLPTFLDQHQISSLLESAFDLDDFDALRDRTIIELLYGTGMRCSELVGLSLDTLDLARHQVKVLGKRNKERLIPLNASCLRLLDIYLRKRAETFPNREDKCLWLNLMGHPLTRQNIYLVVTKQLGLVSTNRKRSPHVLRHTFATHLLNNEADIMAVKELLGHAGLAATQVYTHNTIETLIKSYKQAHPRA